MLGGAAVVRAAAGWHVMVVATDGDFDVVIVDDKVVGWIEAAPAMRWREHLDPRVRSVAAATRSLRLCAAGHDDVPADVPGWDLNRSTQSNQQVCEVLAHALPTLHDLLHGGRDVGDTRLVRE